MKRTHARVIVGLLVIALASAVALAAGGYLSRAATISPEAHAIAGLGAEEPAARLEAVQSLREGGELSPAAITAVAPLLSDEDPQVGYYAALALGETDTPEARTVLIAALESPDMVTRLRAAEALSILAPVEAAGPLARLLLANDEASLSAAKALVKMDSDEARNALWISLADEQMTSRQRAAASAILENGQASVPMLKEAQLSGIPSLRANATMLLQEIGA